MPGSPWQLFRDFFAFRRWDRCNDPFTILLEKEDHRNRRIMHVILPVGTVFRWRDTCSGNGGGLSLDLQR